MPFPLVLKYEPDTGRVIKGVPFMRILSWVLSCLEKV